MSEERRSWLKGCAIGCGVLAAIPLLVVLAVSVRTCVPLGSANRARSQLDERFGPPGSFTPAPDGAVPADRIQVFLDVRRQMSEHCEQFSGMSETMDRVEELDETEMSGREVAGTTRGFASIAVGIAPFVGEFFERRNQVLLEAEMGLSEYAYIFTVAYREQLLDESVRGELFSGGNPVSPDVLAGLRSSLSRQLASVADETDRRAIEAELRAAEDAPLHIPWSDGLPDAVEGSLAPFRERLDAAFCPVTAGIDMDLDSRRALALALY